MVSCSLVLTAQARIVDNANILSQSESANLTSLIDSVAIAYNFDLVIVTEQSIGAVRPMDYADDFFDYNGYGLGQDRDGCLFLRVMGTRDYWFSTSGRGIQLLDGNPFAFDVLEANVGHYLGSDQYYEAFQTFILDMEKFLSLEAVGRRYNFFHHYNAMLVLSAWVIALVVAFAVVLIWKKGMNTALAKTQAAAYVVPGSLSFKVQKDNFLYSTVTKTRRQTQSSSSGRGGGIHTGSSGRMHGGRGGRR
jgi:uncharacterized protein